ncbi:MAG: hypothetical protein Q8L55_14175, partial [Phycisphaerales bacterium]|nr:hypothetical protein [Phycisphaerales bacterium]
MARTTRPIVRQIDRVAAVGITVGGVGVIAAVLVIMFFLVWNVAPLFRSGVLYGARSAKVQLTGTPVDAVADEYKGLLVMLMADGRAQAIDLQTFALLPPIGEPQPGTAVSAVSGINEHGQLALGFDDGSVQIGSIGTAVEYIDPKDADATTVDGRRAQALRVGERCIYGSGYAELTPLAQLRIVTPAYTLNKPAELTMGDGPVVRLDFRTTSSAQFLVTARANGTVEFSRVSIVRPLGGGKPRLTLSSLEVAYAPPAGKSPIPDFLFSTGEGVNVLALWKDGTLQRYGLRNKGDDESFVLAETLDILADGRTVMAARMLLGSRTLVVADDAGAVEAMFAAKTNSMKTFDGWQMVVAHRLEEGGGGEGSP